MTYRIQSDSERRLLRITFRETWTPESFEHFQIELREEIRRLGWQPRSYTCLIDARQRPVQPRDMSERVREALTERQIVIRPRREAVLVGSTLAKLQAKRLHSDEEERAYFLDEAEALDWLAQAD